MAADHNTINVVERTFYEMSSNAMFGDKKQVIQKPPGKAALTRYGLEDLSPVISEKIVNDIKKHIREAQPFIRKTSRFIARIRREIIYLHNYNCKVLNGSGVYPLTESMRNLLLTYIELEMGLLSLKEYNNDENIKSVQCRLTQLLLMVYSTYSSQPSLDDNANNKWKLLALLFEDLDINIHEAAEEIRRMFISKINMAEEEISIPSRCVWDFMKKPKQYIDFAKVISDSDSDEDDICFGIFGNLSQFKGKSLPNKEGPEKQATDVSLEVNPLLDVDEEELELSLKPEPADNFVPKYRLATIDLTDDVINDNSTACQHGSKTDLEDINTVVKKDTSNKLVANQVIDLLDSDSDNEAETSSTPANSNETFPRIKQEDDILFTNENKSANLPLPKVLESNIKLETGVKLETLETAVTDLKELLDSTSKEGQINYTKKGHTTNELYSGQSISLLSDSSDSESDFDSVKTVKNLSRSNDTEEIPSESQASELSSEAFSKMGLSNNRSGDQCLELPVLASDNKNQIAVTREDPEIFEVMEVGEQNVVSFKPENSSSLVLKVQDEASVLPDTTKQNQDQTPVSCKNQDPNSIEVDKDLNVPQICEVSKTNTDTSAEEQCKDQQTSELMEVTLSTESGIENHGLEVPVLVSANCVVCEDPGTFDIMENRKMSECSSVVKPQDEVPHLPNFAQEDQDQTIFEVMESEVKTEEPQNSTDLSSKEDAEEESSTMFDVKQNEALSEPDSARPDQNQTSAICEGSHSSSMTSFDSSTNEQSNTEEQDVLSSVLEQPIQEENIVHLESDNGEPHCSKEDEPDSARPDQNQTSAICEGSHSSSMTSFDSSTNEQSNTEEQDVLSSVLEQPIQEENIVHLESDNGEPHCSKEDEQSSEDLSASEDIKESSEKCLNLSVQECIPTDKSNHEDVLNKNSAKTRSDSYGSTSTKFPEPIIIGGLQISVIGIKKIKPTTDSEEKSCIDDMDDFDSETEDAYITKKKKVVRKPKYKDQFDQNASILSDIDGFKGHENIEVITEEGDSDNSFLIHSNEDLGNSLNGGHEENEVVYHELILVTSDSQEKYKHPSLPSDSMKADESSTAEYQENSNFVSWYELEANAEEESQRKQDDFSKDEATDTNFVAEEAKQTDISKAKDQPNFTKVTVEQGELGLVAEEADIKNDKQLNDQKSEDQNTAAEADYEVTSICEEISEKSSNKVTARNLVGFESQGECEGEVKNDERQIDTQKPSDIQITLQANDENTGTSNETTSCNQESNLAVFKKMNEESQVSGREISSEYRSTARQESWKPHSIKTILENEDFIKENSTEMLKEVHDELIQTETASCDLKDGEVRIDAQKASSDYQDIAPQASVGITSLSNKISEELGCSIAIDNLRVFDNQSLIEQKSKVQESPPNLLEECIVLANEKQRLLDSGKIEEKLKLEIDTVKTQELNNSSAELSTHEQSKTVDSLLTNAKNSSVSTDNLHIMSKGQESLEINDNVGLSYHNLMPVAHIGVLPTSLGEDLPTPFKTLQYSLENSCEVTSSVNYSPVVNRIDCDYSPGIDFSPPSNGIDALASAAAAALASLNENLPVNKVYQQVQSSEVNDDETGHDSDNSLQIDESCRVTNSRPHASDKKMKKLVAVSSSPSTTPCSKKVEVKFMSPMSKQRKSRKPKSPVKSLTSNQKILSASVTNSSMTNQETTNTQRNPKTDAFMIANLLSNPRPLEKSEVTKLTELAISAISSAKNDFDKSSLKPLCTKASLKCFDSNKNSYKDSYQYTSSVNYGKNQYTEILSCSQDLKSKGKKNKFSNGDMETIISIEDEVFKELPASSRKDETLKTTVGSSSPTKLLNKSELSNNLSFDNVIESDDELPLSQRVQNKTRYGMTNVTILNGKKDKQGTNLVKRSRGRPRNNQKISKPGKTVDTSDRQEKKKKTQNLSCTEDKLSNTTLKNGKELNSNSTENIIEKKLRNQTDDTDMSNLVVLTDGECSLEPDKDKVLVKKGRKPKKVKRLDIRSNNVLQSTTKAPKCEILTENQLVVKCLASVSPKLSITPKEKYKLELKAQLIAAGLFSEGSPTAAKTLQFVPVNQMTEDNKSLQESSRIQTAGELKPVIPPLKIRRKSTVIEVQEVLLGQNVQTSAKTISHNANTDPITSKQNELSSAPAENLKKDDILVNTIAENVACGTMTNNSVIETLENCNDIPLPVEKVPTFSEANNLIQTHQQENPLFNTKSVPKIIEENYSTFFQQKSSTIANDVEGSSEEKSDCADPNKPISDSNSTDKEAVSAESLSSCTDPQHNTILVKGMKNTTLVPIIEKLRKKLQADKKETSSDSGVTCDDNDGSVEKGHPICDDTKNVGSENEPSSDSIDKDIKHVVSELTISSFNDSNFHVQEDCLEIETTDLSNATVENTSEGVLDMQYETVTEQTNNIVPVEYTNNLHAVLANEQFCEDAAKIDKVTEVRNLDSHNDVGDSVQVNNIAEDIKKDNDEAIDKMKDNLKTNKIADIKKVADDANNKIKNSTSKLEKNHGSIYYNKEAKRSKHSEDKFKETNINKDRSKDRHSSRKDEHERVSERVKNRDGNNKKEKNKEGKSHYKISEKSTSNENGAICDRKKSSTQTVEEKQNTKIINTPKEEKITGSKTCEQDEPQLQDKCSENALVMKNRRNSTSKYEKKPDLSTKRDRISSSKIVDRKSSKNSSNTGINKSSTKPQIEDLSKVRKEKTRGEGKSAERYKKGEDKSPKMNKDENQMKDLSMMRKAKSEGKGRSIEKYKKGEDKSSEVDKDTNHMKDLSEIRKEKTEVEGRSTEKYKKRKVTPPKVFKDENIKLVSNNVQTQSEYMQNLISLKMPHPKPITQMEKHKEIKIVDRTNECYSQLGQSEHIEPGKTKNRKRGAIPDNDLLLSKSKKKSKSLEPSVPSDKDVHDFTLSEDVLNSEMKSSQVKEQLTDAIIEVRELEHQSYAPEVAEGKLQSKIKILREHEPVLPGLVKESTTKQVVGDKLLKKANIRTHQNQEFTTPDNGSVDMANMKELFINLTPLPLRAASPTIIEALVKTTEVPSKFDEQQSKSRCNLTTVSEPIAIEPESRTQPLLDTAINNVEAYDRNSFQKKIDTSLQTPEENELQNISEAQDLTKVAQTPKSSSNNTVDELNNEEEESDIPICLPVKSNDGNAENNMVQESSKLPTCPNQIESDLKIVKMGNTSINEDFILEVEDHNSSPDAKQLRKDSLENKSFITQGWNMFDGVEASVNIPQNLEFRESNIEIKCNSIETAGDYEKLKESEICAEMERKPLFRPKLNSSIMETSSENSVEMQAVPSDVKTSSSALELTANDSFSGRNYETSDNIESSLKQPALQSVTSVSRLDAFNQHNILSQIHDPPKCERIEPRFEGIFLPANFIYQAKQETNPDDNKPSNLNHDVEKEVENQAEGTLAPVDDFLILQENSNEEGYVVIDPSVSYLVYDLPNESKKREYAVLGSNRSKNITIEPSSRMKLKQTEASAVMRGIKRSHSSNEQNEGDTSPILTSDIQNIVKQCVTRPHRMKKSAVQNIEDAFNMFLPLTSAQNQQHIDHSGLCLNYSEEPVNKQPRNDVSNSCSQSHQPNEGSMEITPENDFINDEMREYSSSNLVYSQNVTPTTVTVDYSQHISPNTMSITNIPGQTIEMNSKISSSSTISAEDVLPMHYSETNDVTYNTVANISNEINDINPTQLYCNNGPLPELSNSQLQNIIGADNQEEQSFMQNESQESSCTQFQDKIDTNQNEASETTANSCTMDQLIGKLPDSELNLIPIPENDDAVENLVQLSKSKSLGNTLTEDTENNPYGSDLDLDTFRDSTWISSRDGMETLESNDKVVVVQQPSFHFQDSYILYNSRSVPASLLEPDPLEVTIGDVRSESDDDLNSLCNNINSSCDSHNQNDTSLDSSSNDGNSSSSFTEKKRTDKNKEKVLPKEVYPTRRYGRTQVKAGTKNLNNPKSPIYNQEPESSRTTRSTSAKAAVLAHKLELENEEKETKGSSVPSPRRNSNEGAALLEQRSEEKAKSFKSKASQSSGSGKSPRTSKAGGVEIKTSDVPPLAELSGKPNTLNSSTLLRVIPTSKFLSCANVVGGKNEIPPLAKIRQPTPNQTKSNVELRSPPQTRARPMVPIESSRSNVSRPNHSTNSSTRGRGLPTDFRKCDPRNDRAMEIDPLNEKKCKRKVESDDEDEPQEKRRILTNEELSKLFDSVRGRGPSNTSVPSNTARERTNNMDFRGDDNVRKGSKAELSNRNERPLSEKAKGSKPVLAVALTFKKVEKPIPVQHNSRSTQRNHVPKNSRFIYDYREQRSSQTTPSLSDEDRSWSRDNSRTSQNMPILENSHFIYKCETSEPENSTDDDNSWLRGIIESAGLPVDPRPKFPPPIRIPVATGTSGVQKHSK